MAEQHTHDHATPGADMLGLAIRLGKALKEDPRLVRMENARKAYETDESLLTLMKEYEVQQKAMEKITEGGNIDPTMVTLIQDRMDALYRQVCEHPVYVELDEAQRDVNELMNLVNQTITFAITGEAPSSCTHDCSTCGGGCSH